MLDENEVVQVADLNFKIIMTAYKFIMIVSPNLKFRSAT